MLFTFLNYVVLARSNDNCVERIKTYTSTRRPGKELYQVLVFCSPVSYMRIVGVKSGSGDRLYWRRFFVTPSVLSGKCRNKALIRP